MFFEAHIVMSSDTRFLPVLRRTIENLTLELGWNESEARGITLAFEEALTNKIRHAYKNLPDGRIQLAVKLEADSLVLELTDQGEPPDPGRLFAQQPDGFRAGGFGTHIIRDVMDSVEYRTTEAGNQLILMKRLP